MDVKYAICVLEALGNGLTLANENDRESTCIMAINALEKLDKIEKTLALMREKGNSEEYHNEGYKTMLLELETLGNIQKIVIQQN